jgi:ADP-heptose:LPS heptosyltransferase
VTQRIVCLKIAARGDLLLASPAFRWLRESRPEARITLLVGRSCEDVARHLPYFDEVRPLDDRALFAGTVRARLGAVVGLYRQLRAEAEAGGAEVLLLQRDWRYAAVAWLARVPRRVGFETPRSARFLTDGYRGSESGHHVADYLGLVSLGAPPESAPTGPVPPIAGGWRFQAGERERALAAAAEQGFHPEGGGWVALGFGGGNNVKTQTGLKSWPVESYAALAERLTESGLRVVWLGDSRDAERLPGEAAGVRLAGRLSVAETAAVLSACDRLVANDSFLLHLGEALGVPTVAIFGPTDPRHFRPLGALSRTLWLGPGRIPCSPCARNGGSSFPACAFGHRCTREISVESVLAAAMDGVSAESVGRGPTFGVGRIQDESIRAE